MRRQAEALKAVLGQIDLRTIATAIVSGCLMWFGGSTWERYETAEDVRREVAALRVEVDRHNAVLVSLPVEELRAVPAKVERIENAVGAVEKFTAQIARDVQRRR